MKKPKFAVKALGCKVNQYEEQLIRENLLRFGFTESDPGDADIFILNSCTVTDTADVKTRKLIRKVKRDNPHIKVFVTGCYAVFEEDIEKLRSMPEVDEVVPGKNKEDLPVMIDSLFTGKVGGPAQSGISGFSDHTRAFLKMQDGCDQDCSYCKVNLVRGPSRSRHEDEIADELIRLVSCRHKEIVLTGICLGSWKGSRGQDLSAFIESIESIKGDFRIRLSSLEPNHITDSLIEAISVSKKVCRHLHVPLQSGSDRVLKLMNRRYDTAQFRNLLEWIRFKMPLAGVTMDVIAGFPDEKEEDFAKSREFINEMKPSRLHVFKYSDRKGTVSSGFSGKIPVDVAKDRVSRLIADGDLLQAEFCKEFISKEVEVLVEERSAGSWTEGYSGEYLRVRIDGSEADKGNIVSVMVENIDKDIPCLVGKSKNV
ncbi:MAG: tRNA (N(6)-L-threonylcarbamoyladenosine(37)-C(2))-methylthiotransferase MtaB [Candidatus Omnitrophota bacterium]